MEMHASAEARPVTVMMTATCPPPASLQVMDALNMEFEDDTFDLVWACESGEHMPDKQK
jgi:MPBQ/MSBQ methyltransferase